MDETAGAQYALQVAFQTLNERCQQYEQRIAVLQEENISLRTRQMKDESASNSLSEIDSLKRQITELTLQKLHLKENVRIVSAENKQLWSRLSELTETNKSLSLQLTKINDTLTQHNSKQHPHFPVIRSKTFTIDESNSKKLQQKNLKEENDKISLELEDISLKLINSMTKEKVELELQCSQMAEIQKSNAIINSSFGIGYPEEDVEDITSEIEEVLKSLCDLKEALLEENEKLQKTLRNLEKTEVNRKCTLCIKKQNNTMQTKETSTQDMTTEEAEITRELEGLMNWATPQNSSNDKICPVCCLSLPGESDVSFHRHVEEHFITDDHPDYNVL